MKKENTTRFAILGLLSLAPCSGYDLKKLADFSISHFWSENYGHIYPVLRTLEAEGLVAKESQQTRGRPQQNVYRITEKGSVELNEWLKKPVEYHPFRNELLLKIFFATDIPLGNVKEKLQRERERQAKELEILLGTEAMLKNNEPYMSHKGQPLWLVTVELGKRISKTLIEWCDAMLDSFESGDSRS